MYLNPTPTQNVAIRVKSVSPLHDSFVPRQTGPAVQVMRANADEIKKGFKCPIDYCKLEFLLRISNDLDDDFELLPGHPYWSK